MGSFSRADLHVGLQPYFKEALNNALTTCARCMPFCSEEAGNRLWNRDPAHTYIVNLDQKKQWLTW